MTPVLYDRGNNAGSPPQKGNGNVINDGTRISTFDALNRLLAVNRANDGAAVGSYVYDAVGRRIIRQILGAIFGTIPTSTDRYLLAGQQVVDRFETRTGRLAPSGHLYGYRLPSKNEKAVAGHMSNAVDKNVNPITTN